MSTKTIITPSLYQFAFDLQEAVQQGYELTEDGAVSWGLCYEAQMVKRQDDLENQLIADMANIAEQPVKRAVGRPKQVK